MLLAASASLRNQRKEKEGSSKEEGSRAAAESESMDRNVLGMIQACLALGSGCAAWTLG